MMELPKIAPSDYIFIQKNYEWAKTVTV